MPNRVRTILLISTAALLLVTAAIFAVRRLYQGDRALLRNVSVQYEKITPNADGDQDAARIIYQLTTSARVSIYFEDDSGRRYYFRQNNLRGAGDYQVDFSGVVDGYLLPNEQFEAEVLSRLLPNDRYTWVVVAAAADGSVEQASGAIEIALADSTPPDLRDFAIAPNQFTPNRDGIDDRVTISLYLTKDADLSVEIAQQDGVLTPIAELPDLVSANEAGWHFFDYEGGVDFGAQPPQDGVYPVIATAADAEGQRVQRRSELALEFGGVPRAQILSPVSGDTLRVSAIELSLCDTLYFTATVENYGETPIRTTGPASGTVYDSDWNFNTLGWNTESGAFRFAIGYEDELRNYPFRWAIGDQEQLEKIGDHYYLMPGDRAIIRGGIRLVDRFGVRDQQLIWGGLIHEDVEISQFNNRVDPKRISININSESGSCPERQPPLRAAGSP